MSLACNFCGDGGRLKHEKNSPIGLGRWVQSTWMEKQLIACIYESAHCQHIVGVTSCKLFTKSSKETLLQSMRFSWSTRSVCQCQPNLSSPVVPEIQNNIWRLQLSIKSDPKPPKMGPPTSLNTCDPVLPRGMPAAREPQQPLAAQTYRLSHAACGG